VVSSKEAASFKGEARRVGPKGLCMIKELNSFIVCRRGIVAVIMEALGYLEFFKKKRVLKLTLKGL